MHRFAIAACLLSAVGCIEVEVTGTGGTLPSGRSIEVNSDRFLRSIHCESVNSDTEAVRIASITKSHKIRIEPTAIKVDGAEVATIPEATKSVLVEDCDGRLQIAADGTNVYDEKF